MSFKKYCIYIFSTSFCFFLFCASSIAQDKTDFSVQDLSKIRIVEQKTGVKVGNNRTLASLYEEAVEWLKTPYRRGGMSHKGMDCSGLASTIYQNVFGVKLQRRSNDMSKLDVEDLSKDDLKAGDLVFFATSRKTKGVNHVGVYLGNDQFVHASTSNGVIISNLNEGYYKRTWVNGGRVNAASEALASLFTKKTRNLNINKLINKKQLLLNDVQSTKIITDIVPEDNSKLNML